MPLLSFATTLLALLVAFATPATASSSDPDLPHYDNPRGSGLPHCECDAYHNGAFEWMSRMCMKPFEEGARVVCYPTRIGHPGTVLAGRYYNNVCDDGQSMCSPWTKPTEAPTSPPPSPPPLPPPSPLGGTLEGSCCSFSDGQRLAQCCAPYYSRCDSPEGCLSEDPGCCTA